MNFLTFYTLASNFLAFWGLSIAMFLGLIEMGAPGGSYVVQLIGMVVVAAVISLMPFIVPMLVTAFVGLFIASHGEGVWLLEFFGAALLLGSLGLLLLFGQVNIDSLKARYWKHMWTHKSPLENRIGASSPYVEMESGDNWRLFFYPVLAPFLHFGLAMREQEAIQKSRKEQKNDER